MAMSGFDPNTLPGWDNPNLDSPGFTQALNGIDELLYTPLLIAAAGLVVICALWDQSGDGDMLQFEVQPAGSSFWIPLFDEYFAQAPVGPSVRVKIPLTLLAHGTYGLRFKVRSGSDLDYRNFSREGRMTLDFLAPYETAAGKIQPPEAVYPAELPDGVDITQTTLDNNPNGFNFLIPSVTEWRAGDAITGLWFSVTAPQGHEPSLDGLPLNSQTTTFILPISAFAGLPNGFYHFYYQLTDFAGNKSLVSQAPTGRNFQR